MVRMFSETAEGPARNKIGVMPAARKEKAAKNKIK